MIFNLKNCSKSDLGAVSLAIGPRGGEGEGVVGGGRGEGRGRGWWGGEREGREGRGEGVVGGGKIGRRIGCRNKSEGMGVGS